MSKISKIAYDVFEIGTIQHVTQFTRFILRIADYVQIKVNDNMRKAIRRMEKTKFTQKDIKLKMSRMSQGR